MISKHRLLSVAFRVLAAPMPVAGQIQGDRTGYLAGSKRSPKSFALPVLAAAWLAALAGWARAQPVLLKDLHPGTGSSNPRDVFNSLVFGTLFAADDGSGVELFRTDGTPAGTVRVRDIAVGGESSDPREFILTRNGVVFAASSLPRGVGFGREPWVTDGTEAGTVQLKDIRPGTASSDPSGLSYSPFLKRIVFSADDGAIGRELWVTDGTPAETRLLADIRPGAAGSTPMGFVDLPNGNVLFFADDGQIGHELWGLRAAPFFIKDINPGGNGSVIAPRPVVAGRNAFFFATDGVHGEEIWRSDGTANGTLLLADINPGFSSSRGFALPVNFGSRLYFSAMRPSDGEELWSTDGTAAGTTRVADIWPGPGPSSPRDLTVGGPLGQYLVFTAQEPTAGRELYVIESGVPGVRLFDIEPGPGHSGPGQLTRVGEFVYFTATRAGTQFLMRLRTGSIIDVISSFPDNVQHIKRVGAGLMMSGLDQSVGQEPYVLDIREAHVEFLLAYPCGSFQSNMSATLPILGTRWRLSGVAPPAVFGLLTLTPNPGRGTQVPFAGCKFYLSSESILVPVLVDPVSGAWAVDLPLPDDPSLQSLHALLDSIFLTPSFEASVPPPGGFWLGR